MLTVTYAECHK